MKIALVLPGGVDPSGVHNVVPRTLALIARLATRHELHVFAFSQFPNPGHWILRGAHVHNAGSASGTRRRFLQQLRAEHREAPFDVIHAFFAPQAATAALAARWCKVPLIFHASGGEFVALDDWIYGMQRTWRMRLQVRLAIASAFRVTVATSYMRRLARAVGAMPELVPLGVALDEWPVRAPRPRVAGRPIRLLQIADVRPVKDQPMLLATARELVASGWDVEVDVAGADTMQGVMQRSPDAIALGARVRWHGVLQRPELRALVEHADFVVITSRHESGPLAALEAAIAGVPVVGTAVGHLDEWAPDAAVAVPAGDASGLAREIAALLADDERRVRMAHDAQQRAIAANADVTAARFERLYDETRVDHVPASDPFASEAALPFVESHEVLGVAVELESNSRWVLARIRERFPLARPALPAMHIEPPIRIRIVVRPGQEDDALHAPVHHECPDAYRVVAESPASRALSDPLARRGIAHVTTALAADRLHFGAEILDTVVVGPVSVHDRHPVHAAALIAGTGAILLAGPSGAGKSTLSYVAHRAGLQLLAEDRVYIQTAPTLRAWGTRSPLRLSADVIEQFPELRHTGRPVHTKAGQKYLIELPELDARAPNVAERIAVCVLARGAPGAPVTLERIDAVAVRTALWEQLRPGFDRYPDRVGGVFDALAAGGGWRLSLSDDAEEAIPALRTMLGLP